MAIKIIIKRKVSKEKEAELVPLLMELRSIAVKQSGYISGETLRNADNPEDFIVISTWQSIEDWRAWLSSPERIKILEGIDALLDEKTSYGVYYYG